jgi:hypothetical protein
MIKNQETVGMLNNTNESHNIFEERIQISKLYI